MSPPLPGPTHTTGVTEYLETASGSEDVISELVTEKCPEETVRTVFAGVHCILTSALRLPRLKSEVELCTVCVECMCLDLVMTYNCACEAQADQTLRGPHFTVEPHYSGRLCMGHLMAVIER